MCDLIIAEVEAVALLSKRVREVNIQARSRANKDTWPPGQPKIFTPLTLIQHQSHLNLRQSTAMAEFVEQGGVDEIISTANIGTIPKSSKHPKLDIHKPLQEVLDTSKVTKEVAEILAPLEISNDAQFILIEGAPGIGKTVLLKEIACRWGDQQILRKFKLVLLVYLRDPAVQQMSLIDDLLQSFCKRDKEATEVSSACRKYFVKNNGKDLAILLDGYDEYPKRLQEDSLIADILKREVLPCCGLIVSSRPRASVNLREQATVKACILGFTEAEREYYIKESMKDRRPKEIDELTKYLQDHLIISSLCFVPFNMVVLVYLYKQGIPLPKNSVELYNYFICLTVHRHLAKHGHDLQGSVTELTKLPKLTDFPEPYNKIIQQLSQLSLEALHDDKLIFTSDDIKAVFQELATVPGAIEGFGLLQAVEHFSLTGKTMTFNFLHFSIQEYLAAHHIANLPADEELRILKEYFWSDIHSNMFSIYITLTKGQRPSFKQFLCNGNKAIAIADEFLEDHLQCLRLYRCFHEADDVDICKTIEQSLIFDDDTDTHTDTLQIKFVGHLMASDLECVSLFLTSSLHKVYTLLYFWNCHIQDHGLSILHRGLQHCSDITINELELNHNSLTMQSSSLISDITVRFKVKKLAISYNHTVGENEQLYTMLSNPLTQLEELLLYNTKLSSKPAIALFKALENNNKLKNLYIYKNNITDDACDAITTALQRNSCLEELYIHTNPLTGKAILKIVNGLEVNNALENLQLPVCPEEIVKEIRSQKEDINKKRKKRGCQVRLKIIHFGS